MISVEEAVTRILSTIPLLGTEKVGILSALGRVLGEDVFSPYNIPPADNSAMDGYAVQSADTKRATVENPVVLDILEDIPAGTVPRHAVTTGKASRIMTGAPIPPGADAVVPREDTESDGRCVRISVPAPPGAHIRRSGEDVREGEKIIARGAVIRPAEVGMIASLGRSFIACHQRPLVAILSTGDELIDVDERPSAGKIVSSNSYSLAALVAECGAVPLQLGIARDTREDLLAKLTAAQRADVIITSGGVSVGDYDLVKDIMQEVGNHMQFWKVAMRPGRPLAFGALGTTPLFGLPGNPVSAMVSFEQFVRPSLLKMMGHRNIFRRSVRATLTETLTKGIGARQFVRGRLHEENGRYTVASTGDQGSGILMSMVLANGLIVLPEHVDTVAVNEEVAVMLLDDSLGLTSQPGYL